MVFAGAFLFYERYLVPLGEREAALLETQKAIDKLKEEAEKVKRQQQELEPWRKLSLPNDLNLSQLKYAEFLNQIMKQCGFTEPDVKLANDTNRSGGVGIPTERKETPAYRALSFTLKGRGDLTRVVQLLVKFYSAPLLHKIKKLSIRRPATGMQLTHVKGGAGMPRKEELEVELAVEAIIVSGAEDREELLPKASAHNLARAQREYLGIAGKDPFYPPPPPQQKPDSGPDPARSIKLTMITRDEEEGCKAVLLNEAAKTMCFLCPKTGHVRFQIWNKGRVTVDGEVIQIDEPGRKLVFSWEDRLYALPLDQTVADALLKPLTMSQMKALELTRSAGGKWGTMTGGVVR